MLARSISFSFNPIIIWPVFLIVLFYGTGMSVEQQQLLWLPVSLLELVVPAVVLVVFMKLGYISDVDISQVKQRRLFFVLVLLAHTLATTLVVLYGSKEAAELRSIGLAIEIVGTIITFFWKISGHLAVSSFVITAIVLLKGWQWAPLFVLLPVIAWSRVVLHKHTIAQTVAGSVLPISLVGVAIIVISFVEKSL